MNMRSLWPWMIVIGCGGTATTGAQKEQKDVATTDPCPFPTFCRKDPAPNAEDAAKCRRVTAKAGCATAATALTKCLRGKGAAACDKQGSTDPSVCPAEYTRFAAQCTSKETKETKKEPEEIKDSSTPDAGPAVLLCSSDDSSGSMKCTCGAANSSAAPVLVCDGTTCACRDGLASDASASTFAQESACDDPALAHAQKCKQ